MQTIIHLTPLMKTPKKVIAKLEIEAKSLFKRLYDNRMKANLDKCYLLIASASQMELKIGNETIKSNTIQG